MSSNARDVVVRNHRSARPLEIRAVDGCGLYHVEYCFADSKKLVCYRFNSGI
jgi:hypothetical protein